MTSPEFDKEKAKRDCRIVSLDVTGVCESAKIEMRSNNKLLWTDYLSLLKFENAWKIVAKAAHKLNDRSCCLIQLPFLFFYQ